MDGTPQLLTSVQFAEAKKGYDRDQVDNFLRELGVKVTELKDMLRDAAQRAEAAEATAAEAVRGKAAAEAVLDKARADLAAAEEARRAAEARATEAASSAVNEAEAATGVLAMAHKTAEATVADAETKAKQVVADARETAAKTIAEVEREVERIRAEATAAAEAAAAGRANELREEIRQLGEDRTRLAGEVERLGEAAAHHRARLRDDVDALTRLLDAGAAAAASLEPSVADADGDTPADDGPTDEADDGTGGDADPAGSDPSEPTASADAATEPVAPEPVVVEPVPLAEPEAVPEPAPTPIVVTAPEPAEEAGAPDGDDAGEADDEPAGLRIVTVEDLGTDGPGRSTRSSDPEAEFPVVKIPELLEGPEAAEAAVPPPATPTPSLFSVDEPARPIDLTSAHDGQPTAAFDVLASEDDAGPDGSPLGEPEPADDEAMKAFFEQDLDTLEREGGKGKFLRRR